ncbi:MULTISPECIES: hypothetical protein [Cryobacterium]|uniref:hypothetical protein n=1 Tax=Cryobacterium TaxID=69578 RepID=UPI0010571FE4|nr:MULTISPECIES: hypothetical protein [Cryobacterium]TFC44455.1 hypothetical protein E3O57_11080 [Cryobacterium sp. TMN-39-2]TFC51934.1 hypothetical protein E3O68_15005 [Cryobacterium sp. TMB3-1-2]TFC57967.1 hypothetical protein E3O60_12995 [Cryobacterium sp. TMB1-7]TFC68707.1 hypothetical protein E3T21_14390 [Cryobacterium sp. TMB3-15]TFC74680.1 hypothetical protein E3T22_14325 [Cryobacterium sp. TMB3-10]
MFGRRKPPPREQPAESLESPGTQALMRHVQSQLAEKPLLGAQIAGKEIYQNILTMVKDERGVQIEVVATILGGLAGRACLIAGLSGQAGTDPTLNRLTLNTISTKDGGTYLAGDAINRQLAERQYSVFALIVGYLRSVGEPIPEAREYFVHSAQSLGGPAFGVPRFAPGTGVPSTPLEYADALWPNVSGSLRRYAPDPQLWPTSYGIAIQLMLEMAKTSGLDLQVLVRVVMDSALAVSKVPLKVPAA